MKLRTVPLIPFMACLLCILLTGPVSAEEPDLAPKAAIEQTTVTFSPVIAGTDVTHVFTIANHGAAPLNIPGVYAG